MYENEFPESAVPKIIAGAIMNGEYLSFLCELFTPECLPDSIEAQTIVKWCINYFKTRHKAPQNDIELIYIEEQTTFPDKAQWELLGYVLEAADESFTNDNGIVDVQFLKEMTLRVFNKNRLTEMLNNTKSLIDNGLTGKAEEELYAYRPLEDPDNADNVYMFSGEDINLYDKLMNTQDKRTVFKLPGAMGKRLNSQLVERGLIGILAPEKRGKTWLLMELAYQATRSINKCNVLFLQAGDMTNDEITERYSTRIAGRPLGANSGTYYKPIIDCKHNQEGTCPCFDLCEGTNELLINSEESENEDDSNLSSNGKKKKKGKSNEGSDDKGIKTNPKLFLSTNPDHVPCSVCKNKNDNKFTFVAVPFWERKEYTSNISRNDFELCKNRYKKAHKGELIFEEYANCTLSLERIQARIRLHNGKGRNIRLVCIDYADILLMPNQKEQARGQQNSLWMGLRRIAQEENILLIVPTQADAASYQTHTLDMSNFSEDKRKFGHVTSMWGLNQTPNEKRCGILRINEIVVRGSKFDSTRPVTLLQCLEEGNPLIASYT